MLEEPCIDKNKITVVTVVYNDDKNIINYKNDKYGLYNLALVILHWKWKFRENGMESINKSLATEAFERG